MQVRLVSFEVGNITRYMSVTGKRREIAGASEVITYLDRVWVDRALAELWEGYSAAWRIEQRPVELLFTGAGQAKVLVREGEPTRGLVSSVTSAALREAPGLDVYGAVSDPFDWEAGDSLHSACKRAVSELSEARAHRPSPEARFPRLPLMDACASTDLPARSLVRQPEGLEGRSAESIAKWVAYGRTGEGEGLRRLSGLIGTDPEGVRRVVDRLNDEFEWVGVVYVDGNGLGQVFQDFTACVPGPGNRLYADTLRAFTDRLQECSEKAFLQAVESTRARMPPDADGTDASDPSPAPVLPLILGGDDVVAMCPGGWALPFTRAYLEAYEEHTAACEPVATALRRRDGSERVTASAGVALVKTKFPYVAAARLAGDLLDEAKQVKWAVDEEPCSALAFHVLYDSSGADLSRIRSGGARAGMNGSGERGDRQVSLVAQPYVVGAAPEDHPWVRGRRWTDLEERVAALRAVDAEGERLLPSAQLHSLREGLFAGPEIADARLRHLEHRYAERGLQQLLGDENSLFWSEPGGRQVTGLLDAMAAVDFLPERR